MPVQEQKLVLEWLLARMWQLASLRVALSQLVPLVIRDSQLLEWR